MRFALGLLLVAGCGGAPFAAGAGDASGDLPVDDAGWVEDHVLGALETKGDGSPEGSLVHESGADVQSDPPDVQGDVARLDVAVHDAGAGDAPAEAQDGDDAAAVTACEVHCNGCCDPSGACLPGSSSTACGQPGGLCVACPSGGACQGGLCADAGGQTECYSATRAFFCPAAGASPGCCLNIYGPNAACGTVNILGNCVP